MREDEAVEAERDIAMNGKWEHKLDAAAMGVAMRWNRISIEAEKEDGADGQKRSSASGDGKMGKKSETENSGNDQNSYDRDKETNPN